MAESLSSVLRQMRMESLFRQAEFIRDCWQADCYTLEERTEEARGMIRAVLYERALGQIDDTEKQRIVEILQFAKTPCTIEAQQPIPAYQDEEAERKILEETGKDVPKKQQTFFFMP